MVRLVWLFVDCTRAAPLGKRGPSRGREVSHSSSRKGVVVPSGVMTARSPAPGEGPRRALLTPSILWRPRSAADFAGRLLGRANQRVPPHIAHSSHAPTADGVSPLALDEQVVVGGVFLSAVDRTDHQNGSPCTDECRTNVTIAKTLDHPPVAGPGVWIRAYRRRSRRSVRGRAR